MLRKYRPSWLNALLEVGYITKECAQLIWSGNLTLVKTRLYCGLSSLFYRILITLTCFTNLNDRLFFFVWHYFSLFIYDYRCFCLYFWLWLAFELFLPFKAHLLSLFNGFSSIFLLVFWDHIILETIHDLLISFWILDRFLILYLNIESFGGW